MGAWGNIDPNTATFTTANMLPPAPGGGAAGGGSWQHFQKLAKNTGYNYRHTRNAMLIMNELFVAGQEKDYDIARIYTNSDVMIISRYASGAATLALPAGIDTGANNVRFLRIVAAYQDMLAGGCFEAKDTPGGAGGFRVKNNSGDSYYLLAMILELRQVTGV